MSTEHYPLGKFNREELERYVFPHVAEDGRLLASPRFGSDFNAVEIPGGQVLVASTDPLAISPQLGWRRSARLAFHVIASDVAVSGISPDYLISNWNLPPDLGFTEFEEIWSEFVEEADGEGVAVVGGHTGRAADGSFPTVGAGTVFGLGSAEELIRGDIEPGDGIYLLNNLGIESVAIFSFYFPEKVKDFLGDAELNYIRERFDGLSPTKELTSMAGRFKYLRRIHDIAEGGLIGGLQELLGDVGRGVHLDLDSIEVDPRVETACAHLDLDPLKITSLGSALAVLPGGLEERFERELNEADLDLSPVGRVVQEEGIVLLAESGEEEVPRIDHDEFWARLDEFAKESS